MKRLNIFLLMIIVTFAAGCSSKASNNDDSTVSCLGEQCSSVECVDQQLLRSEDGKLDFCESPAFGTFSIEKDGITWYFGESVSYGQFVNGDYWVLDKGNGVKITKVTPGPQDGYHGSMINPRVGSNAYDKRLKGYDVSQLVTFPATLKAGDSLVSTASVLDSDLNWRGLVSPSWYDMSRGMDPNHVRIKNASVLTVVSEVPAVGSFRPPYIGTEKKIYNVNDINRKLLKGYPAPSSLPDVGHLERGLERVWLMHNSGWTSRAMHPIENMHNYYREIGTFLSNASLVLMTDKATPKLLNGFIQTGIDQYYTIKNGYGSRATYEFQTILTGLLLSDSDMANVWVEGRSKTPGRVSEKFYYMKDRPTKDQSSIVPKGQTWTGFNVGFTNYTGQEHEHLHPSEWHKVVTEGGAKKTEVYRHCCNSIPWFGMGLASRVTNANRYWPNLAFHDYIDRWVWESKNGYDLDVIQKYYPSFYPDWKGNGSRQSILGSQFLDDMYLAMGFSVNVAKPTHDPVPQLEPEPLPDSQSQPQPEPEAQPEPQPQPLPEPQPDTGSTSGAGGETSSTGGEVTLDEVVSSPAGGSSNASNEEATQTEGAASESPDQAGSFDVTQNPEYVASKQTLDQELDVDRKALLKEYRAKRKARKSEFNSRKARLTRSFKNGNMSRKEFIKRRKALRAKYNADNAVIRETYAADKAVLQEAYDADSSALIQQFSNDNPNRIEDTRSLPSTPSQ